MIVMMDDVCYIKFLCVIFHCCFVHEICFPIRWIKGWYNFTLSYHDAMILFRAQISQQLYSYTQLQLSSDTFFIIQETRIVESKLMIDILFFIPIFNVMVMKHHSISVLEDWIISIWMTALMMLFTLTVQVDAPMYEHKIFKRPLGHPYDCFPCMEVNL